MRLCISMRLFCLLFVGILAVPDPQHCEVCLSALTTIHGHVKQLSNPQALPDIENLIEKFCVKNKKKSAERKLCYYILPIKRTISKPLSYGMDAAGICKKLDRASAEICTVKYPIKTGPGTNYKKMRVKQLKKILSERGVTCRGCAEKRDFIKKCQKTEL